MKISKIRKFLNKYKLPKSKLVIALLAIFVIVTPVSANEVIKLNKFSGYIRESQDLNSSNKPEAAGIALQRAKDTLNTTLIIKSLKHDEVVKVEKQIEETKNIVENQDNLADVENLEVKDEGKNVGDKTIILKSPTPSPTPTTAPVSQQTNNPTSTPASNKIMTEGKGSVALQNGQSVNFSVYFPKDGGSLTIKGTGACTGEGSGNFESATQSRPNGDIFGTFSGSCQYEGSTRPVTGTFHGFIYLTEGRSDGTAGIKLDGSSFNSLSGTWAFTFTP